MASDIKSRLRESLDAQRRHALGILDGLDDAQLHRAVLPSGWSCVSLIRHLTIDVERFWFRAAVAGEEPVVDAMMRDEDGGWHVEPGVPAEQVLADYREEIARANAVIDATDITAPPRWWPVHLFGDWRLDDLGDVLVHVLVETSTHAGHLDAARELIDGRQWLVLTG